MEEEVLAAASHKAIVRYSLEKQHPGFQPAMHKSELMGPAAQVERHSHFLSDELRKSGHDLYSVQTGDQIEFQVTRQNNHVASVVGNIENGTLIFKDMGIDKKFTRALAGATSEKVLSCGATKIRIEGK